MMRYFDHIRDELLEAKQIIFYPKVFFKKVKKEKGIKKSFKFMTFIVVIAFIFLTYYYLDQLNTFIFKVTSALGLEAFTIEKNIFNYLAFYLTFIIIYVVFAFFRYYITHMYARLFGAKHKYEHTYKAMSYSLAPDIIVAPLFVALVAVVPYVVLYNNFFGWFLLAIVGVPYLIITVYSLYLRSYALSSMQGLSMLKSFVIIYVLTLLTQILLAILVESILIAGGFVLLSFM